MTSSVDRLLTVGIHGFDRASFLAGLKRAGADSVIDIRARRGLRGSLYAWANSLQLQELLATNDIPYVHMKEFAPSQEIRQLQRGADEESGTSKRDRRQLSAAFVAAYQRDIIREDATPRFLRSTVNSSRSPALLCVERHAEACHRSLLAAALARQLGVAVTNITP